MYHFLTRCVNWLQWCMCCAFSFRNRISWWRRRDSGRYSIYTKVSSYAQSLNQSTWIDMLMLYELIWFPCRFQTNLYKFFGFRFSHPSRSIFTVFCFKKRTYFLFLRLLCVLLPIFTYLAVL